MFKTITAFSKIAYDKVWDYGTYYLSNIEDNCPPDNEHIIGDEEINSIFELLNLNYSPGMKRLYPEPSYYDMYSAFINGPDHIIDNIWLGSSYNAASYDSLIENDINIIINVSKEITHYYPEEFEYKRYTIYDNNKQSIEKYLEEAYNDILYHQQNSEGNILVHCFMGRSRSVSIVIYYIMKQLKHDDGTAYSFKDAIELIKKKRPIVNPTIKFTNDLLKLEVN